MPTFRNLSGERFGRLTVVDRDPTQRTTYWNCICDCGRSKTVRAGNLTAGGVQSCGCLHRDVVRAESMVGRAFSRLTVLERAESTAAGAARWRCLCGCGAEVTVLGSNLRSGNTKSCGCQRVDSAKVTNLKHGMADSLAYKRWESIKQRCTNPNNPNYRNYGGRGISMCEEWSQSFEAFFAAVGECPGPGMSIDRIDNDGNYEPGNVRWATAKVQMNNRQPYRRASRVEMEAAVAERDAEIARLRAEVEHLKGVT